MLYTLSVWEHTPDTWYTITELLPSQQKILLLDNLSQIYTLSETDTLDNITISITNPLSITKDEYSDYGFDDISKLTTNHLSQLSHPVQVLVYKIGVDNETPNPTLQQEYALNVGVRQMMIGD